MWNLNNLLNNIFNLVYSNNLLKNYLIKKGGKKSFIFNFYFKNILFI